MILDPPSELIGQPAQFLNRASFDVYGDKEWYFKEELEYYSPLIGKIIRIPVAFIFDFASIPRIARPLIPVAGRHRYPAGVHDWLFASLELESLENIAEILTKLDMVDTRELADAIFDEANKVTGVPTWKRWSMHKAVRAGGWVYYNPRQDKYFETGKLPEPSMADLNNLPPINFILAA